MASETKISFASLKRITKAAENKYTTPDAISKLEESLIRFVQDTTRKADACCTGETLMGRDIVAALGDDYIVVDSSKKKKRKRTVKKVKLTD
jgi:histone H3/H4